MILPSLSLTSLGECGEVAMGEMAGLEGCRPESCETEEVALVWEATEGEAVRAPLGEGEAREVGKGSGMKPVSWSSWGPDVSRFVSIEENFVGMKGIEERGKESKVGKGKESIPIISYTCPPPISAAVGGR
jgi:hypothetical protein